jgi:hypothetical protein
MNVILTIAGAALLIVIAIALGLKFFNSSVKEQEHERGWDE